MGINTVSCAAMLVEKMGICSYMIDFKEQSECSVNFPLLVHDVIWEVVGEHRICRLAKSQLRRNMQNALVHASVICLPYVTS